MRQTIFGASLSLALAACSGGEREQTVAENLAATAGVEAGGAAEAGRPLEMNVTNTAPPAEEAVNAAANSAAE